MSDEVPWCTHAGVNGWSNAGWAWVHPLCGKPTRQVWEGTIGMPDTKAFLALPPRGLSESRAQIGPDKYTHYTLMCDAHVECYAVAYGKSEESVRMQLDKHVCPAPARLDEHSTNKTAVQLMWEELDDTIDKIKSFWNDAESAEQATYAELCGKADGLAFALAVSCRPYYRTREDVLRQSQRRWAMRTGASPFEITPGYNYYPSMPLAYAKREDDEHKTAPRKTVKTPINRVKPAVTPAPRAFTVAERESIIELVTSGVGKVEDVAKMYNVSVERILTMIPKANDASTLEGFLFS